MLRLFLQDFSPGVNVSMGPWLGTVVEVYRKVVLRIKNGSRYYMYITVCKANKFTLAMEKS